jgi:hypothetical protein
MSVIDVTKMWSKTGGAVTSEKADALDQKYSITEGYQVLAQAGDDITTIWNATGLPAMGEQHASGLAAFVTSKTPTPLGPIFWIVVVAYEGESPDPDSVEVEWTDTTTTEQIDRDIDGAAIVTVNGEQVDGLSMDVADQVVVIRRKFLTVNTAAIRMYRRATNSDIYLGWPPGTARLVAYAAKNRFKYGAPQEQWDVTARIQFREPYANTTDAEAWYKRWRHEGLYENVDGFIQRAVDDKGQEVTRPVLLKIDGTREPDPNAAHFFHTQVYGSLAYSGLGLI